MALALPTCELLVSNVSVAGISDFLLRASAERERNKLCTTGCQVLQFACRVLDLFKDDKANLWNQLSSEACVKVGVSDRRLSDSPSWAGAFQLPGSPKVPHSHMSSIARSNKPWVPSCPSPESRPGSASAETRACRTSSAPSLTIASTRQWGMWRLLEHLL